MAGRRLKLINDLLVDVVELIPLFGRLEGLQAALVEAVQLGEVVLGLGQPDAQLPEGQVAWVALDGELKVLRFVELK